jgi:hypothetical protein
MSKFGKLGVVGRVHHVYGHGKSGLANPKTKSYRRAAYAVQQRAFKLSGEIVVPLAPMKVSKSFIL